jgi:hypothetical protein
MRIAKSKTDIEEIRKRLQNLEAKGSVKNITIDNEINSCYVELEDTPTGDFLKKNRYGKWVCFSENEIPPNYEMARTRYEIFVGGFLYFFENHEKKSGKKNRILYFDWGKINKNAALTIFMKPFFNNPYYGTKEKSPKSKMVSEFEEANGQNDFSQSNKMMKTAIVQPLEMAHKVLLQVLGTDPPPPPPPPPPSRE